MTQNGHFFVKDDKPFFWLADTGWEVFHRFNREEAIVYLKDRADKEFNVIQMVAIGELGGDTIPNAYGDLPLDKYLHPIITPGNDYDKPDQYDYWDHVEFIIQEAVKRKIIIAFLPCWGEYITHRFRKDALFRSEEEAYHYGNFLGKRFREYNNHIVWVMGGDRLPNERIAGVERWNAMAEGVNDGIVGDEIFDRRSDYTKTTMTFHCYNSSSRWFHGEAWIDFHTWGSYHEKRDNERAYDMAYHDWNLDDPKPTINSEPAYEDGNVNYDRDGKWGKFDDFDIRQIAYWSVFSGCAGHSIGVSKIWRAYKAGTVDETNWKSALTLPGAGQMRYLKNLMLSRPYAERIPSDLLTPDNPYDPVGRLQGTHGENYAFIYVPTGKSFLVDGSLIKGKKVRAWWYNPRNGEAQLIGIFGNTGIMHFDAPGETSRGNDWVLVLDNADIDFTIPGKHLKP